VQHHTQTSPRRTNTRATHHPATLTIALLRPNAPTYQYTSPGQATQTPDCSAITMQLFGFNFHFWPHSI